MDYAVYAIPIIMALASLFCGVLGSRAKRFCGPVATAAMFVTLILSSYLLVRVLGAPDGPLSVRSSVPWITAGGLSVNLSFHVDALTTVMLMVVSFVGFWIFLYANGYMAGHPRIHLFFCYFSMFACAMYILVLADNLPLLFVGWEGVGLCSYLLIGYYREEDWCNDAGRKAFIVNRIGDFGFLLGMFVLFWSAGTLEISELINRREAIAAILPLATLLLFVGATGKSAQIPLYVWLPDAMAGPTPVSALIHAATMVTAGVYMVARLAPLFVLGGYTMTVVAVIGTSTAMVAGFIALTQNDIKKVLAYSTVSQLGYMFLALGTGAFTAAIFHLFTHAFFKGCLFLGAGSVICALHHEQDMRKMGGLRKKMPVTFLTFVLSGAALAGVPLLSGSISKDAIIESAFTRGNYLLWFGSVVTAVLTAFYTFRAVFMTFFGRFRGGDEAWHHVNESPRVMTLPLVVLAFFAVIAGAFNWPHLFGGHTAFSEFLEAKTAGLMTVAAVGAGEAHELATWQEWLLTGMMWVLALCGVAFAALPLRRRPAAGWSPWPAISSFSIARRRTSWAWMNFTTACSSSAC
ncbi:NADH-quinone oxidoreductase subunit L [bacterium]|nr:NADH-quinone oxidoreductase subunit L [bacterium]